jgi:SAM-dependent methyltransferase
MTQDISTYSQVHRHFLTNELPPLLLETAAAQDRGSVADLGAGDGAVLWALEQRHLLGDTAYAVDISPERVAAAKLVSPRIRGVVADATDVRELPDESVDGVIVSQVIEHIPDDRRLAPELARLLKPGGWWYVGSVLKGTRAWWFYRVDGVRRLDPTHVREYESPGQLVDALAHPALGVTEVRVTPMSFPVVDLAARAGALARLFPFERLSTVYVKRPALARLRNIRLRVPGYSLLEVSGRKAS